MNTIEAPKAKRKFSQSCKSKQEFVDMIAELRELADKETFDPNNLNATREWQDGFSKGKWNAFDMILSELTKCYDTKKY